jgi:hypothetical protein
MGYMQDADRWLDTLLADVSAEKIGLTELKRAIREKLLESYRNGQKAPAQESAPRRGNSPRFRAKVARSGKASGGMRRGPERPA